MDAEQFKLLLEAASSAGDGAVTVLIAYFVFAFLKALVVSAIPITIAWMVMRTILGRWYCRTVTNRVAKLAGAPIHSYCDENVLAEARVAIQTYLDRAEG